VNDNGDTIIRVHILPSDAESPTQGWWDETSPHDPATPVEDTHAVDPDDSWLTWLANRSRQMSASTRWLLIGAMLLCVASMIWICMAIIRSAPRRGRGRMFLISTDPLNTRSETKKCPIIVSPHMDYPTDKMDMLLEGYSMSGGVTPPPPPPSESGAPPAYDNLSERSTSPTVHKKLNEPSEGEEMK